MRISSQRSRTTWRSSAARRVFKMAGDPPTVTDAVRIVANKLLDGVRCAPTDLDALGLRLNIYAVDTEDLPFSGELRRDEQGFRIVCSKHLSPARRRFTIAHEMGHAILETSGPRCPRVGGELERICDKLATELLMPEPSFLHCAGSTVSVHKVFELADLFGTSLSATAIRCAELFGVSVFGTDNEVVSWARGVVKTGSTFRTDSELKKLVERAGKGYPGQELVYLHSRNWTGEWSVEWAPAGRNGKAIFLLRPYQPMTKAVAV